MSINPTIKAYDDYAEIYDAEVVDFWNNFPAQAIQEFVAALPGKKVLNLGSGSGRDALLLKSAGLTVTCLDASRSMCKLTEELGFPTIHTDFASIDIKGQQFDGVWAYTSLIHVPTEQLTKTVSYLRTQLPANGVLFLGLIAGNDDQLVERASMPGSQRYFRYYQSNEIDAIMRNTGYSLLYSDTYQPRHTTYLNRLYKCDQY